MDVTEMSAYDIIKNSKQVHEIIDEETYQLTNLFLKANRDNVDNFIKKSFEYRNKWGGVIRNITFGTNKKNKEIMDREWSYIAEKQEDIEMLFCNAVVAHSGFTVAEVIDIHGKNYPNIKCWSACCRKDTLEVQFNNYHLK